ncbi:Exonuclease SbcC [Minicystis rosea]|nr:Exonuclease SbcC [Minicystis rosea]
MKLLRLRVAGLRSFTRETEIDLGRLGEQGLFAISGPTGAGKSTILDGIFLALFGKCPRGEAGECVSAGAVELAVRLELSLDGGREMAVERRFRWSKKRKADPGAVGSDLRGAPKHPPLRIEEREGDAWTPVDLGGRKPDEYLATQIVKVSMSDFQQAVVLPQGEFDALLRAKPAERRTLVASLFRTEHLGAPLIEVLRTREMTVRSEMGRLEEAERELAVSDADADAAGAAVEAAVIEAEARGAARESLELEASALREARRRCALRDEAAAALGTVTKARDARAGDRERLARGRRAASAQAAAEELARTEKTEAEAEARAKRAEDEAHAADVQRRSSARVLAEASAARTAELPGVLSQLERARQAEERGRDLAALDGARAARDADLSRATASARAADGKLAEARAALAEAEVFTQAAEAKLAAAKVGEDERAEAVAMAAMAELLGAEERLAGVMAAELAAAEALVAARGVALGEAEDAARRAEAEAHRAHAARRHLEIDAQRAAEEVERAERALTEARHAAAAADLASTLRAGDPCPVCGAREHPGADHRLSAMAISLAERNVTGARRAAKTAEQARADAASAAGARDEEARSRSAQVETALAAREEAAEALSRQRSGEAVPRAVAEARATLERVAERAELSLGAIATARREAVREEARLAPKGAAEARIAALNKRAREAEAQERTLAAAKDRAARAQRDLGARTEDAERAARTVTLAEAEAKAAAKAAEARREEVRALLADLEPRGQRDLFGAKAAPRSATAWVMELSARADGLTQREEAARAAVEEARAQSERLGLEAREATVRRDEARAQKTRARASADEAMARAGFASLVELRAALLDPTKLAALEEEIERLDREHARLAAVLAERARDVEAEVSEAQATEAERARDEARREAIAARDRAAQAAAQRDEIARRRARARELRSKIDEMEPRAKRLGQIRHVVGSNQLSEHAAERHLEAVTRGAAALLRTLSSDRYELVRTADGAFAVADTAHGKLVRPPSTLSGGETFLVSLSLSLALSERIQMAGRTRFDFFFLDEGFGSLDPATLEIALGALEKLRGPNRVIGMISHVGAIEERMPRRLRVWNERRGGPTMVAHEL